MMCDVCVVCVVCVVRVVCVGMCVLCVLPVFAGQATEPSACTGWGPFSCASSSTFLEMLWVGTLKRMDKIRPLLY